MVFSNVDYLYLKIYYSSIWLTSCPLPVASWQIDMAASRHPLSQLIFTPLIKSMNQLLVASSFCVPAYIRSVLLILITLKTITPWNNFVKRKENTSNICLRERQLLLMVLKDQVLTFSLAFCFIYFFSTSPSPSLHFYIDNYEKRQIYHSKKQSLFLRMFLILLLSIL